MLGNWPIANIFMVVLIRTSCRLACRRLFIYSIPCKTIRVERSPTNSGYSTSKRTSWFIPTLAMEAVFQWELDCKIIVGKLREKINFIGAIVFGITSSFSGYIFKPIQIWLQISINHFSIKYDFIDLFRKHSLSYEGTFFFSKFQKHFPIWNIIVNKFYLYLLLT